MPEQIVEILNRVREDRWHEKLRAIKKGIDEYEKRRSGQSSLPIDQIVEQHLNPILPTYWEVFNTHNCYRRKNSFLPRRGNSDSFLPSYDVGIFLIGFSSLPIVLSVAEIQPHEQIYFLFSSDTDETRFEIADRIKVMLPDCSELIDRVANSVLCPDFALKIDEPSDPVDTFKLIKKVIDKVGANKRVALDITGGKKTMIGGGFTAGSILGIADSIHMFYIDSLEYDQHRGAPIPGTEFLSLLENPYDVYNVQTTQEAVALYSKHNYEAAAKLWEDIKDKLERCAT
ncbi:MAG: hypothetical protein OXT74_10480, partial [Candidatus Poribacteria bacterium]|nr:hypothetical protein [Candidatus Poribacteria bacterium]